MARILVLVVTISLFSQALAGFCSDYQSDGKFTGYACEDDTSHYCYKGENEAEEECEYGCDFWSGRCKEPDYCEATKSPSGLSFCASIVTYRIDQNEDIASKEHEAQTTYSGLLDGFMDDLNARGLQNVSLSSCEAYIKKFACRATYAECAHFPGQSPFCLTACEDTNACIVELFEQNNETYSKAQPCDVWCDFSGMESILPSFGAVLMALVYLLL